MSKYFIHESNLERLEKKITTIKNKCNKHNVAFSYSLTGEEEFRTVRPEDPTEKPYIARFVEVEVEGSLKHEGWKFAAVIEHHDACNVIRSYADDLVVPEKYLHCSPECEHCNRIRSRRDTYLIVNEAGEFKQVGKACLNEYTNGLNAEEVARFISLFEEMIKGSCYGGSGYRRFLDVKEVVKFAFECTFHFGYEKSSFEDWEERPKHTTRDRVSSYMMVLQGNTRWMSQREVDAIKAEMSEVGFNPDSERAVESAKAALEWIRSEKPGNSQYINNLIGIASDDYVESRDFGLLVSLPIAYLRHIEEVAAYEKKQKERESEADLSQYVGEVGQRVIVGVSSFACIASWDTQFGTTWLYKFTDECGNVFMWYASKCIEDDDKVTTVTGTVKQHEEYKGVRQTVLTRCKVS